MGSMMQRVERELQYRYNSGSGNVMEVAVQGM